MQIRYADTADRKLITRLWKSCFEDDDSYIEHFLDEMWQGDNCLVVEVNGLIVSMLFLLPAEVVARGSHRPSWYIYACATLPGYRGFGYMQQLLQKAYHEAVSRFIFSLLLVPASESLFLFYEKSGFIRLYKKVVQESYPSESIAGLGSIVSEDTIYQIASRRNAHLARELDVCWGANHLRFVLNDLIRNGGGYILSDDGFDLIENQGGHYLIKERLPEMVGGTTVNDYAMIRFCQPYEINSSIVSPYINLVLD